MHVHCTLGWMIWKRQKGALTCPAAAWGRCSPGSFFALLYAETRPSSWFRFQSRMQRASVTGLELRCILQEHCTALHIALNDFDGA